MVKKPTLILLAIFMLLAAFAWWFQKSPYSAANSGTATPTSILSPLANWKIEDTRQIKFFNSEGSPLSLRMGKSMIDWSIDEDTSVSADSGKVMQLLSELQSMQPIARLETGIDEKAVGLVEKARKITLVDSAGTTKEITMGNETATSSGTYVKIGSDVYIMNTQTISSVTDMLTLQGIIKQTETPIMETGTPQP